MALTMRRATVARPAVSSRTRTVTVQASASKHMGAGVAAVALAATMSLAGPALADLNAYEAATGAHMVGTTSYETHFGPGIWASGPL